MLEIYVQLWVCFEDIPLGYKAQNRSLKIMYDKSMSLISV